MGRGEGGGKDLLHSLQGFFLFEGPASLDQLDCAFVQHVYLTLIGHEFEVYSCNAMFLSRYPVVQLSCNPKLVCCVLWLLVSGQT